MKPICFMIMPYGKKTTQAEAGHGVVTVDFNAAGAAASSARRKTISASSRACDLKGEARTWNNKPRSEAIPVRLPHLTATSVWMKFSAGTSRASRSTLANPDGQSSADGVFGKDSR
jgi:hypothetical protein